MVWLARVFFYPKDNGLVNEKMVRLYCWYQVSKLGAVVGNKRLFCVVREVLSAT